MSVRSAENAARQRAVSDSAGDASSASGRRGAVWRDTKASAAKRQGPQQRVIYPRRVLPHSRGASLPTDSEPDVSSMETPPSPLPMPPARATPLPPPPAPEPPPPVELVIERHHHHKVPVPVPDIEKAEELVQSLRVQQTGLRDHLHSLRQGMEENSVGLRKELGTMKRGLEAGCQHQLASVKGEVQGEVARLQSELMALERRLWAVGALHPQVPVLEKEEATIVGTVFMPEDVFTARFLMRVGWLMSRSREHSDASSEEDGSADSKVLVRFRRISHSLEDIGVLGIQTDVLDEERPDFVHLTKGWTLICITTLIFQFFITQVMLVYGAGSEMCFETKPTRTLWWTLHGSKFTAVIVAGCLMGKHFMDIMTTCLAGELILDRHDPQVILISTLRLVNSAAIGLANVFILLGTTSPADVWLNMVALGFIGDLDDMLLHVARRGVFGGYIGKAMTALNFTLTFTSEYPWWWGPAHGVACVSMFICVAISAVYVFVAPDPVCDPGSISEHDAS